MRIKKIILTYNRIFSAFGEGQFIENLWPSLRKAAMNGENFNMTSGKQIRDFIEVKKIALNFLEDLNFNNENIYTPRVKKYLLRQRHIRFRVCKFLVG